MSYRSLLTTAFRQSWKFRFLWILGFFAALAGNGGEYELIFSGSDSLNGQSSLLGFLRAFYEDGSLHSMFTNIGDFLGAYPIPSIFLALLLIILFLLVVWLVIVFQAALFWAIDRLRTNQKVTFPDAFHAGTKCFTPVFLVNLVLRVTVWALFLIVAFPLGYAFIKSGTAALNNLYILTGFIILVPLTFVLSLIMKFATLSIVLRNAGWRDAIRNGWSLFHKHWLATLEIGLMLFVINYLLATLLTLLLLFLGLLSNAAGFVLYIVILTVFGAFLATFQYWTWTSFFVELEQGTIQSKLLRWSDLATKRFVEPEKKSGTIAK